MTVDLNTSECISKITLNSYLSERVRFDLASVRKAILVFFLLFAKTTSMHTRLQKLVKVEKRITTHILDLLQELNDSHMYLDWGYASLYDYLTRGLGYSEAVAYQRWSAIRLMKDIPEIKNQLEQGSLNFSTLTRAYQTLKGKTLTEKRKVLQ